MERLSDSERVFHGEKEYPVRGSCRSGKTLDATPPDTIAQSKALDAQLSLYGRRLLAYTAGPYRDKRGEFFVEQNIRRAESAALSLWRLGYAVICPHKNTAHFGGAVDDSSGGGDDIWLEGDFEMVARCDLVVMLPGWEESQGAQLERRFAMHLGIPVFYWPECAVRLKQYGEQVKGGIQAQMEHRRHKMDQVTGRWAYEVRDVARQIRSATEVRPAAAERPRSAGEGGDASWRSEQEGQEAHSAPGGSDRTPRGRVGRDAPVGA